MDDKTSLPLCNESDAEHYAEWLEWRKGVEFHHEDEWDALTQRDDMFLDSEYSYTVYCSNLDDFVSFATRLKDTSVLEVAGIIVTVWAVDDDGEEDTEWERHFLHEDLWDNSVLQMYNMEYNPCMTPR